MNRKQSSLCVLCICFLSACGSLDHGPKPIWTSMNHNYNVVVFPSATHPGEYHIRFDWIARARYWGNPNNYLKIYASLTATQGMGRIEEDLPCVFTESEHAKISFEVTPRNDGMVMATYELLASGSQSWGPGYGPTQRVSGSFCFATNDIAEWNRNGSTP